MNVPNAYTLIYIIMHLDSVLKEKGAGCQVSCRKYIFECYKWSEFFLSLINRTWVFNQIHIKNFPMWYPKDGKIT